MVQPKRLLTIGKSLVPLVGAEVVDEMRRWVGRKVVVVEQGEKEEKKKEEKRKKKR